MNLAGTPLCQAAARRAAPPFAAPDPPAVLSRREDYTPPPVIAPARAAVRANNAARCVLQKQPAGGELSDGGLREGSRRSSPGLSRGVQGGPSGVVPPACWEQS